LSSLHLAWILYVPIWVFFAFLIWPEFRQAKLPNERWMKIAMLLTAAWVVIAVLSLVDIGSGKGLYYSAVTYDHTTRVALTDAIYRTGFRLPTLIFMMAAHPMSLIIISGRFCLPCSAADRRLHQ